MKQTLLRTLGLAAIVALSNLPIATAAPGDCHITCCNGSSWDGAASHSTCCDLFDSLCGNVGTAYTENGGGGPAEQYCPSFEIC
jgi:hypothetical protein